MPTREEIKEMSSIAIMVPKKLKGLFSAPQIFKQVVEMFIVMAERFTKKELDVMGKKYPKGDELIEYLIKYLEDVKNVEFR